MSLSSLRNQVGALGFIAIGFLSNIAFSNDGGTSVGGGGSLINGVIVDALPVVNPKSLNGYDLVVAPVILNVKNLSPSFAAAIERRMMEKTWILSPASMVTANEEITGIPVVSDQVARQTDTEVWIDKLKFNKLTALQRGQLILHEVLLSFFEELDKKAHQKTRRMFRVIMMLSSISEEAFGKEIVLFGQSDLTIGEEKRKKNQLKSLMAQECNNLGREIDKFYKKITDTKFIFDENFIDTSAIIRNKLALFELVHREASITTYGPQKVFAESTLSEDLGWAINQALFSTSHRASLRDVVIRSLDYMTNQCQDSSNES